LHEERIDFSTFEDFRQKVASPLPPKSPFILNTQLFIYLCDRSNLAKFLMISSIEVAGRIEMKGRTDKLADENKCF
jgi:hypothetical protein